jgi:hypothetical protein
MRLLEVLVKPRPERHPQGMRLRIVIMLIARRFGALLVWTALLVAGLDGSLCRQACDGERMRDP